MQQNCKQKTNLSDDEFKIVLERKLYDGKQSAKSLQCYALCYIKENKFYTDQGPNIEHLRVMLPIYINDKQKSYDTIEKCARLTGGDECERGYKFISCLMQEMGLSG